MRIDCTIEGYTDNFIEVTDNWTRGEYRQLTSISDLEEYLSWFRQKVTGVKLSTAFGEYITDPTEVTLESLDDMALTLTGFVERALYQATGNLRSLGNASGRVSFGSFATKMTSAPSLTAA